MSDEENTGTGSEPPRSEVLGGLPRSRPHRRSDKRPATRGATASVSTAPKPAKATAAAASEPLEPAVPAETAARPAPKPPRPAGGSKAKTLRQPPQPRGVPPQPRSAPKKSRRREPAAEQESPAILTTAVQTAAELAEMGLSAGARVLRSAVSRLPRP